LEQKRDSQAVVQDVRKVVISAHVLNCAFGGERGLLMATEGQN
jgi:hypothetical protein